ncbi:hypothetical protein [Saccharicrinis sp. FJH54]|uniref:hypothetical protein n=1 Tax=Saccharicrinis sp. FJH54 TaxID=3344665 RepID=UPI0035D4B06D
MSINHLNKSDYLNIINKVIGILSILLGLIILSLFIYIFIKDILSPPGRMGILGFASDMYLASWVYSAILVYAGLLLLKRKIKAIYLYQFVFMGLIIEYVCYKLVLVFPLIDSPFILIVYLGFFIYFKLPGAIKVMDGNVIRNNYKVFGLQVLINVGLVGLAILYDMIKH